MLALLGGDTCKPIDHAKQIDQRANYTLLKFIGVKGFVVLAVVLFLERLLIPLTL